MKTLWRDSPTKQAQKTLSFTDLKVGDSFSIATTGSKGAVYEKCYSAKNDEYFQREIATGQLFPPTASPVKLEVVLQKVVTKDKPKLYSK